MMFFHKKTLFFGKYCTNFQKEDPETGNIAMFSKNVVQLRDLPTSFPGTISGSGICCIVFRVSDPAPGGVAWKFQWGIP
jgi:hypothetical protein